MDRHLEGPIRSRDVAQGRHTFHTLCAACHAGRVNPEGYHWSPAQMRHQIRFGNLLMPALPPHRLSDERVEAVLAYLSTVGAIDGELPPERARVVDPVDDALAEAELAGLAESDDDDAPPAEDAAPSDAEEPVDDGASDDAPHAESAAHRLADPRAE